MTTDAKKRYALIRAADALERGPWLLNDLIADDGKYAALTSADQIIWVLRALVADQ